MTTKAKTFLALALGLFLWFEGFGTHLRAGYIRLEPINGQPLTFNVIITVYTNIGSASLLGGFEGDSDLLAFGDGTSISIPATPNVALPELGENIGSATYSVVHTYPGPGKYRVTYREPNRNAGIINMENSVNTEFYLETEFVLDPFMGTYESPVLMLAPVYRALTSFPFAGSAAASDPNDFRLFYKLVVPQSDQNKPVVGYKLPENFELDDTSGLMTWDNLFYGHEVMGEYAFAVDIVQVKDEGIIGTMRVDFQIILEDGVPGLDPPVKDPGGNSGGRIFIPEGQTQQIEITTGIANDIKVTVASELSDYPQLFQSEVETIGEGPFSKKISISITNAPEIIRDNYYQLAIRVLLDNYRQQDVSFLIATKDIYYDGIPIILGVDSEEQSVLISPNPVKDRLQIEHKHGQTMKYRITDLSGRVLTTGELAGAGWVDFERYPTGVYLLILNERTRRQVVRLIKN